MKTKEEYRAELNAVQSEMFKLSLKGKLSEDEEAHWKELFEKQMNLQREMYSMVKEKRFQ